MYSYNYEQGTPEWHEIRLGRFTGSEINRLIFKKGKLTKGAITYIGEKVTEHFSRKPAKDFEGFWMDRGKELEPQARSLYELSFGVTITNVGFITHGDHAGMSSDGMIGDHGSVEIKCPKLTTHYDYCLIQSVEDLPDDYYWQMQMCMMVSDRMWCDFISYHPEASPRMKTFRVKRNEEDIKLLKNCLSTAIAEKEIRIKYIESLPKY